MTTQHQQEHHHHHHRPHYPYKHLLRVLRERRGQDDEQWERKSKNYKKWTVCCVMFLRLFFPFSFILRLSEPLPSPHIFSNKFCPFSYSLLPIQCPLLMDSKRWNKKLTKFWNSPTFSIFSFDWFTVQQTLTNLFISPSLPSSDLLHHNNNKSWHDVNMSMIWWKTRKSAEGGSLSPSFLPLTVGFLISSPVFVLTYFPRI